MYCEHKTDSGLYQETLTQARQMTARAIRIALQQRGAMHHWAIKAYETALAEKDNNSPAVGNVSTEVSQTEIQKLRQALEKARHTLVRINRAVATEHPELFDFEAHPNCYWKIDNGDAIATIDRALALS